VRVVFSETHACKARNLECCGEALLRQRCNAERDQNTVVPKTGQRTHLANKA
jgi:hypothetical protein